MRRTRRRSKRQLLLRKWSGLGSNAGAFPCPAQGQVQRAVGSTGGSTAVSLVSDASAQRKHRNALYEPPMVRVLLPVFNDHWLPHNPLRHSIPCIGLQMYLTGAGIALRTSELNRAVVSMATVNRGQVTRKSLGLSLALLASCHNHHSLLSSISKASIGHRKRIEQKGNIYKRACMNPQAAPPPITRYRRSVRRITTIAAQSIPTLVSARRICSQHNRSHPSKHSRRGQACVQQDQCDLHDDRNRHSACSHIRGCTGWAGKR